MSHTILVVDDEPGFRELYTHVLKRHGFVVRAGASVPEALSILATTPIDLVVSDVRMPGPSGLDLLVQARTERPGLPFVLVTAYTDVRQAVEALKMGAVDYLAKPIDLDELVACVRDTLGVSHSGEGAPIPPALLKGVVTQSVSMRGVIDDAWQVAHSDVPVLIGGESGVGKEVVAQFIHRASARADAPFIAVNCAALPAELIASELFGHARGAFTGAVQARIGRIREAQGGVLFLDEIGDMPLSAQPILLRVLQERRVRPVGGTGDKPVDFRLVAASNVDLEAAVQAGRFRADLFYRLNVISLNIPPLRDRPADVAPLARRFLAAIDGRKRLARATLSALAAHDWPGNVRELHNAVQRAALLTRGDVILPEALPRALRQTPARPVETADPHTVPSLRDVEIATLKKALIATGGNRTQAAEMLGITRRGLLKKLKRFELTEVR